MTQTQTRTWRKWDPAIPCQVCRATGKVYVEHPDGSLSEARCPYCKGRKDSAWVDERFWSGVHRRSLIKWGIVGYLALLIMSNGWEPWTTGGDGPAGLWAIHVVLWGLGLYGIVWCWMHPKARKHHPIRRLLHRREHAPGFTDNRERIAGAAFMGGVMLKARWDQSRDPRV